MKKIFVVLLTRARRVLCAQQRTCQKIDEYFSKKMWTSRIIQTLKQSNLLMWYVKVFHKINITLQCQNIKRVLQISNWIIENVLDLEYLKNLLSRL